MNGRSHRGCIDVVGIEFEGLLLLLLVGKKGVRHDEDYYSVSDVVRKCEAAAVASGTSRWIKKTRGTMVPRGAVEVERFQQERSLRGEMMMGCRNRDGIIIVKIIIHPKTKDDAGHTSSASITLLRTKLPIKKLVVFFLTAFRLSLVQKTKEVMSC
jgi:hypothetical protein